MIVQTATSHLRQNACIFKDDLCGTGKAIFAQHPGHPKAESTGDLSRNPIFVTFPGEFCILLFVKSLNMHQICKTEENNK